MENENSGTTEQFELIVKDGRPMVSSLQIAERFGKEHFNVMRDIKRVQEDDDAEFNAFNFEAVNYTDEKGESRPMYHLTRDAFMLVVMSYTGKEAMRMKKAYIRRFNEMETFILNQMREEHSEEHITAGQKAAFHPQGERLVIAPRKACSAKQIKGLSGLLDFWSFIGNISREEVENRLCTAIPVSSLDKLPQKELETAYEYLWRAIFTITEDTSQPPATPEERRPLDGLLDFWVYCGDETRSNVNNAICQTCNLTGINAIPATELQKAMLVAFMGIVRHTFDGGQRSRG